MTKLQPMRNLHLFRVLIYFNTAFGLLLSPGAAGLAEHRLAGSLQRPTDDVPMITGENRVYQPPPDSRISRDDHTGGGVRACGEEMAALAPRLHHIGQSLSTRPTFAWYGFGQSVEPLEFHLYRYLSDGSLETIFINPIGLSTPGYMTYTLPSDQPDLNVGDTYLWQVVLYCDQNLEDVGRWTSADVEIVEPPVSLPATLPDDSLQRAQAYASYGLWYDAMAAIYDAETPEEQTFRQNLLLDLADLEAAADTGGEIDLSAQLRQIAALQ